MPNPNHDFEVLVIGEINPDIVVSDPSPAPVFNEIERIVDSISLTLGSSSVITAHGAAKLGLDVAFYGVVGNDYLGRYMLDAMHRAGIDISACIVDSVRPTGSSVILTSGHDRAVLTAMGTIGAMDVDRIPSSLISRSRHIHSGCFYLQHTSRDRLPAFFAAARATGITTSFDTNWDPSGGWEGDIESMIGACDVFFPNSVEARRIARVDDVEVAARYLAGIGASNRTDGGPIVCVKLGADGAIACRAGGPLLRVGAMEVEPLDTTGAGDSFNAGFLYAWLDGQDVLECLRWGGVCGALSTRGRGGVAAQPALSEAVNALALWPDGGSRGNR